MLQLFGLITFNLADAFTQSETEPDPEQQENRKLYINLLKSAGAAGTDSRGAEGDFSGAHLLHPV